MVIQDGIRKTAILIDSVDQPTAEILFRQISFELAGQVRTALLELGDVDPAEREQILAEFLDAGFGPTPEILEAEFGQAANLPATQETAEGPAVSGFPVDNDPHDVEPELPQIEAPTAALARGLAQEHAQTICLVLAVHHRQADHFDFVQGFLHGFQLTGLDDGNDQLHRSWISAGGSAACRGGNARVAWIHVRSSATRCGVCCCSCGHRSPTLDRI